MATDREVMQMALEALELEATRTPIPETAAALTALRARLAEPEPEPVAWMVFTQDGQSVFVTDNPTDIGDDQRALPLYAAPPTRRPLTDEEILKTVGWEIAEMYFKLTPGFPVAEARAETLKNARAIERAHKITGGNDE